MELDDHDYPRNPDGVGRGAGPRPPKPKMSFDGGLSLGLVIVGIALSALIITGFNHPLPPDHEVHRDIAYFDPYYNGGYLPVDVNTASREDLLILPMISEKIADGIIARRPFKLTEELLEVKGIGQLNVEIISLYLYGFEDAPEPRPLKPPGIPDA